jgi:hypothetical protein
LENLQCEDDPRFVTALPERKGRVKSGQVAAKGEGRRCRGDGNTAGGVGEGKWEGGRGAKRSHDTFLSDDEDDCRAGGFTGLGVQARKVTSGGACVGVGRGKDSGKTRRTEDVGFEAGKSRASCTGGGRWWTFQAFALLQLALLLTLLLTLLYDLYFTTSTFRRWTCQPTCGLEQVLAKDKRRSRSQRGVCVCVCVCVI